MSNNNKKKKNYSDYDFGWVIGLKGVAWRIVLNL